MSFHQAGNAKAAQGFLRSPSQHKSGILKPYWPYWLFENL